jgi:hypothetical protein
VNDSRSVAAACHLAEPRFLGEWAKHAGKALSGRFQVFLSRLFVPVAPDKPACRKLLPLLCVAADRSPLTAYCLSTGLDRKLANRRCGSGCRHHAWIARARGPVRLALMGLSPGSDRRAWESHSEFSRPVHLSGSFARPRMGCSEPRDRGSHDVAIEFRLPATTVLS